MKKTSKLFVALLLVVVLALPMCLFTACDPYADTVILGSSTELSGDFIWPGAGGSSAGAADQDITRLTQGYATMETDRTGDYVWSKTVVKSHKEEETANGTYLVTIEINPGLKYSNGEEVKAADYLVYSLAFSSPVGKASKLAYNTAGRSLVGYGAFAKYDGTNDGQDGASKAFSGMRLLGEYKFSIEYADYPYYFAYIYPAASPSYIKQVVGEGVEVKDDGNGAYLSAAWYEKSGDTYARASHIDEARYDLTSYPYSGPYKIAKWDESAKECLMELNPEFAGNFEGQKPSIPKILYRKVEPDTQMSQLKSGQVDILEGLADGSEIDEALKIVEGGGYDYCKYDRAGYGKVQFDCDFGPVMFEEVRHAVAYSFSRQQFATTFTGGYGSIVNAPYSVNFQAAVDNKAELDKLEGYAQSETNAKQALIDGGWTYDSKGVDHGASWAPGTGADAVRYKKLSASEYGVGDANKSYKGVTSEGVAFETVEINGEYYLPLVINWMCSENNPVSELLTSQLKGSAIVKNIGLLITKTEVDFTTLLGNIYRDDTMGYQGSPVYSMFNLATGWTSCVYDYTYNWIGANNPAYDDYFDYSNNKFTDPYDSILDWDVENNCPTVPGIDSFAKAVEYTEGKLGMNYLSFAMCFTAQAGDKAEYNRFFLAYMQRWNELLPDIPLYCNIYHDVYNSKKLGGLNTSPFFNAARDLIYEELAK